MLYNRISQLFSALIPSPSNNNDSKMSSSQNNATNLSPSSCHDDDEMSADLLSQESPPAAADTSAAAVDGDALRSPLLGSSAVRNELLSSNTNDNEGGRPSFQSNAGTCHSTNKGTTNNRRHHGAPPATTDSNHAQHDTKRLAEPWRNYGKSYARHSARNPANAPANDDGDATTNNKNDNEATNDDIINKSTPPSSYKKRKTHKLMRRLQQHSTKLQRNHTTASSSSSSKQNEQQNTSSTTNDHQQGDNDNQKSRPTYNNQAVYTSPPSTDDHSPMGQEIEIEERDGEEYYGAFSQLTCTQGSLSNFYSGNVNEEEDGEEEEEVGDDVDNEKEDDSGEDANEKLTNEEDNGGSSSSKADSDPTLVKNYTAALKASSNNHNSTTYNKSNNNATTEKQRGTKRKPTPLDLALIEESTKNIATTAAGQNAASGRNTNRRNKFKALDAALAVKEDSQTPPYDVPTPRFADEGKKEEEEQDGEEDEEGGNNEVDFATSHEDDEHGDERGDSSRTEKQSEALLSSTSEKQSEALLSSTSEKQSEALLSLPSIQFHAGASAATASAPATAAAAVGKSETTTDDLVINLRNICDNLGKALTCPICQCSLREAQLLPCCHAFCKSCLAKTFNPARSNNKGKKKGSPPPTAFKQCPTCKNPADRRSVVPIPQLDEQVKAYKQILRVFGIVPIVYGEGIAMTQLDPEDDGELLNEEDYRQCLQASRTVSGVLAREKEKVEAKAAAVATTYAAQKPSVLQAHALRKPRTSSRQQLQQQQRLTKEQMESQHEMRRWQQVTREQENVVKVNEDALNKVKGQAHQLVKRKLVQAETAKFLASVNESKAVETNKTVDNTVVNGGDNSDVEDFCTAPDGDSVEYGTAKESQGVSTINTTADPSPMVINDGNTVKKAERSGEDHSSTLPGSRVLDLEVSPEAQKKNDGRDSFGTVGTGNASPIVLHDGNTVRKSRPDKADSELHEDKTPRSSGNFSRGEGVAMKRASDAEMEEDEDDVEDGAETQPIIKSFPLKSSEEDDDASEYGAETQPMKPRAEPVDQKPAAAANPSTSRDEPSQREQIVKGSVVMVQSRTWPGINKHGGVGRVTKVHSNSKSGGSAVQYDVAYVLGGKEKFVDESFVHLHKESEEDSSSRVSSARKPRKSSEKRLESRRPKRTQQKVTFKEEVRIYNEEELKHIPAEALEWAGIVPKKGKGKKKAAGKKRALADSNSNTNSAGLSTKKQKAEPRRKPKSKIEATEVVKESNAAEALMAMAQGSGTPTLNEIISPLSTQEISRYADERYSSLLSANGDTVKSSVLNVVTSNLSEEESDRLNSLCKLLKDKDVSLKLMKSFKANKTNLCITSASFKNQSEPANVVSNARTMKVMRCTLTGLPILCPQWVNACLKEGKIVSPTGDMSVRTLPRKQDDNDDEFDDHFGIAKYAAAFQKGMQSNTLLSGVKVLMCGTFGGGANDIKGLLQDAGATIISSVSSASRILSDMSTSEADTTFVFLCDDSPLDKSCGISESLYKQAKKDVSEDAKVMAVHFTWLVDCISCAAVMPPSSYEPIAPRAKTLWRLAVGRGAEEEDRGKKSQVF